MRGVTSNLTVC